MLNALETSSDKNVWELLDPSSGMLYIFAFVFTSTLRTNQFSPTTSFLLILLFACGCHGGGGGGGVYVYVCVLQDM